MKIYLQEVLKREIRNSGKSISFISKECRIPNSVLHGWLQGVLPSAKNLHHLQSLSEYLDISLSVLLFNKRDEKKEPIILMNSEFRDGETKYRLLVEKVKK